MRASTRTSLDEVREELATYEARLVGADGGLDVCRVVKTWSQCHRWMVVQLPQVGASLMREMQMQIAHCADASPILVLRWMPKFGSFAEFPRSTAWNQVAADGLRVGPH